MPVPSPSAHELRRIAVEAQVDPRTVTKWLAGEWCTPLHASAIQVAVSRLGFERFAGNATQTGPTRKRPAPKHRVTR